MSEMDPSGSGRLGKIEDALDQVFRQQLALTEAVDRLFRQGDARLSGIEAEGAERLDRIEQLLSTINLRLAGRP